jgi:hypothetical protein
MSDTWKKFDFEAIFAEKVKALKSTYNCKKCKACHSRDSELATAFKTHQLLCAPPKGNRSTKPSVRSCGNSSSQPGV